jgi:Bacterial Ig-like domain (group 3)/Calx-beta domain
MNCLRQRRRGRAVVARGRHAVLALIVMLVIASLASAGRASAAGTKPIEYIQGQVTATAVVGAAGTMTVSASTGVFHDYLFFGDGSGFRVWIDQPAQPFDIDEPGFVGGPYEPLSYQTSVACWRAHTVTVEAVVDTDTEILIFQTTVTSTSSACPAINVSSPTLLEGDAGTTQTFDFFVEPAQPLNGLTLFSADTADGSASAPEDYEAVSDTGNIYTNGFVVSVTVNGDNLLEDDEYFVLDVSLPNVGQVAEGVGTILNDDGSVVPNVAVSSSTSPSVFGQNVALTATVSPTSPMTHTPTGSVTLSDGATPLATVELTDGSATYTTAGLAVGSHPIVASYSGDGRNFDPADSPPFAQSVDVAASATTLSSSPQPSVVGHAVTLTATVTAVSPGAGTPTGSVSFGDGAAPLGTADLDSGGLARLDASLSDIGAHVITAHYSGDSDFAPSDAPYLTQDVVANHTVSVGDSAVLEATQKKYCGGGPFCNDVRYISFPITLSDPSTVPITVEYRIQGISATAGTQSLSTAGVDVNDTGGSLHTVKFSPSVATGLTPVQKYIAVKIYTDSRVEPDETFSVTLSNPTGGYALGRAQGTGTIIDDDSITGIAAAIGDSSVVEGNSGKNRSAKFVVSLSAQATQSFTFSYAVTSISAHYANKATDPTADYFGKATGTISFLTYPTNGLTPTVKTFTIPIYPDTRIEPDETFLITLTSSDLPAGVTLIRPSGIGTILNDDG